MKNILKSLVIAAILVILGLRVNTQNISNLKAANSISVSGKSSSEKTINNTNENGTTFSFPHQAFKQSGNRSRLKPHHNTVALTTLGCDTTYPPSFSTGTCYDSIVLYQFGSTNDSGFATGENAYDFSELAQRYSATTNDTISAVIVVYSWKRGTTGNTFVKIYTVAATGEPGTLLGTSDTIVKSAIDTLNYGLNFNNVYHFSTPVITSGNFFVSVVIPTTFTPATYTTDELAIASENTTCSAVDDSAAWFNCSLVGGWMSYLHAFQVNIDMMILPVVCDSTGCNLHVTATVINATCDTCHNGSATGNIANGIPPYTWTWYTSPMQTTQTATGLSSGTYTLCVTDSRGCPTCNHSIFIDSTNCLLGITLVTHENYATCTTCNDGKAWVNVTGGTPPYTYLWNTTPTQTTDTAFNLSHGIYHVCVRDLYGCNACDSVAVPIGNCSAHFNLYPDTTTPHHYYAVNMASGVPPISYYWSWGDGTHSTIAYPNHTYTVAGFYTICLQITDSASCMNNTI